MTFKINQIDIYNNVINDFDNVRIKESEKHSILISYLGINVKKIVIDRTVYYQFNNHLLYIKQITYLGNPHPPHKKRIQIDNNQISKGEFVSKNKNLSFKIIGLYKYCDNIVFCDFIKDTYLKNKLNNSAWHVNTNDIFQAMKLGIFHKIDIKMNESFIIRANKLSEYLSNEINVDTSFINIFDDFSNKIGNKKITWKDAILKMYNSPKSKNHFQSEWAGFYLEFLFKDYLEKNAIKGINFVKEHTEDFDLSFYENSNYSHRGDLKASDISKKDIPANDRTSVYKVINRDDKLWYIILKHETLKSKDFHDIETKKWNEWKKSVGYFNSQKKFNELSYSTRFKQEITFKKIMILELNRSNSRDLIKEFNQGKQLNGNKRNPKVIINTRNIDNYLIFNKNL